MKFGVVVFPGSNCDADITYVLRKIMGQEVVELWHKEKNLQNCDMIILPGGFSYGDYLRSGAIARFSPILEKISEFGDKGGYVLGICNGFQILCEAKLVPGTLLHNAERKFVCKNVFLKAQNTNTLLTAAIPKDKILKIPIAHAEGNYFNDAESIGEMNKNEQVLFRYCDEKGNSTQESNPNGSLENIAGVCNKNKNIFGIMPHPERASDNELGNTDGKFLLASILNLVQA